MKREVCMTHASYVISATSSVDISEELFERLDVKWIPFHYQIDGRDFLDDLGESISLSDFYEKMIAGSYSTTSQINVFEYLNYFEQFLEKGKDIIHLCLSSGITGEYNNALIAKDELLGKYPERKIFVLDSLNASAAQFLLVKEMAKMRDQEKSIEEINDWVINNRDRVNGWFLSSDLTYYIRGGRISKTKGAVGNALNICPVMEVNRFGELIVREKVRTKKRAVKVLLKKMATLADDGKDYDKECLIIHSHDYEGAIGLKEKVLESFPKIKKDIEIYQFGTIIGSHTGPGTLALVFWGEEKGR